VPAEAVRCPLFPNQNRRKNRRARSDTPRLASQRNFPAELNRSLQIEAGIISFWFFNPFRAPDGAARPLEPEAERVLFPLIQPVLLLLNFYVNTFTRKLGSILVAE